MTTEVMNRPPRTITKIIAGPHLGGLWLVGWLFTIGFVKLSFWKGVLALIAWPYFIGVTARGGG
jgi:hypothetical protein